MSNIKLVKEKSGLFAVCKRELHLIAANVCLMLLIFTAPLVYPFLYNSIYMKKFERDVPLSVVDLDHSQYSRQLIRSIDAHELLHVSEITEDIGKAYENLQTIQTMGIVVIPSGFEEQQKKKVQSKIHVATNNTRFMVVSDINRAIGEVISQCGYISTLETFQKAGFSNDQAKLLAEPVHSVFVNCFNITESYGDVMIAALFIVILQQSLLIGIALSMASENEDKSIPALLRLSKNSPLVLLSGKGCLYLLLYASYAVFFFTFHTQLYKVPFFGSYTALSVLFLLLFPSVIIIGLFLGSFFKTRLMALIVLVVTAYPIFLISGYAWPFQSLPPILQHAAQLLPSTPFFNAYAVCTKMGGSLKDIIPQLLHMTVLFAVYYVVYWIQFKFLIKKNAQPSDLK